jgi:hypothetical protein
LARVLENAASQSLLVTLGQLLLVLWPYLAVMGGIAVIIGSVTLGIKYLSDAWNAEAIAAEKANKSLKEQKTNYEDTKKAYEELMSAIEEHKTASDALDDLTRGTKEWKE